jgi:SAM-dependent methyltransferase
MTGAFPQVQLGFKSESRFPMTEVDVRYVEKVLAAGLIGSPCLELGVGYEGVISKDLLQNAGVTYFGTDAVSGKHVDFIVDFEESPEALAKCFDGVRPFQSVLALNVLEHTFDPIRVLDNIFHVLSPGGTCVLIAPAVWPLHDFPRDCWRINPNFYEEYCEHRSLHLLDEHFDYVGFHRVRDRRDANGAYVLPNPSPHKIHTLWSRVVHKVFNTFGRGMCFPSHVALGVVIRKPSSE